MKHLIYLLIPLGLALAASVAQATPTHECSNGCFVVTCSGGDCSLYYCSGDTGCEKVTDFINPQSSPVPQPGELFSVRPDREQSLFGASPEEAAGQRSAGPNCGTKPCTIRLCSAEQCELWGFRQGAAYLLAAGQNLDAWFEALTEEFVD